MTFIDFIAQAGLIGGSILTLYKLVGVPLRKAWRLIQSKLDVIENLSQNKGVIAELQASKAELSSRLASVQAEFQLNGGNTLRDVVVGMRRDVKSMVHRVSMLIDAASMGVMETDADGSCTHINQTLLEWIARADYRDLLGHGWKMAIQPSEREEVAQEWRRALTDGRIFEMNFTLICRHDPVRVRCIATPSKEDGKVIGWLAKFVRL